MYNRTMLFVSSNISSTQTGGGVCSMRNLELCEKILGLDNVEIYALNAFSFMGKSFFVKILSLLKAMFKLLMGYSNGSTWNTDKKIVQLIKEKGFDFVFIDSSLNGLLVKRIKTETTTQVICFFHNCEKNMVIGQWKTGSPLSILRLWAVIKNEKKTCKYADYIIALNKRDNNLIEKNYKRKVDLLLPISLKDTVKDKKIENRKIGSPKKGLFVGSYFFGNVDGLKMFIHNVLPHTDMQLTVVGKGMKKLNIDNSKVTIYDGVKSIASFYIDADFVIAPIVSGGGMKVKIAEAMMYGKKIVGTPEAFQGYEKIPCSYICETYSDFVETINSLSGFSYNTCVREYFLSDYETNTQVDSLKKIVL
ncbi:MULTISPECIES: glycosyltransferase [Bacteroides]|mgnify:CR=1 FL=1|uniref:glycosyltransferase n=2 Tax=Bacteroides TaxID=816 RepID=UPI000E43B258|nr:MULTISPECIES: glycosyltransferase [Bacteroides]MBS7572916.1 glycosyltransferase family 4 protein [Bacteroides propionicigenes]RGM29298.1 glycosyltransferase [Bacteroides sp. OM08-17BH]HBO05433.1 hypothetical protein [Bacteroides sp.]